MKVSKRFYLSLAGSGTYRVWGQSIYHRRRLELLAHSDNKAD